MAIGCKACIQPELATDNTGLWQPFPVFVTPHPTLHNGTTCILRAC